MQKNLWKHPPFFVVFTLFFILIFMALGIWQLQRKAEKEALIESVLQNQNKPPENADNSLAPQPFQPLYAEGHFLPNKTIFLQAKTYKGKSGVYVFDVLQTLKGQFLLVQRGWASKELFPHQESISKIEGVAREPAHPTYFQPANKNPTYFWIDLKTLTQDLNVPLLPYYVVAKESYDERIYPVAPLPHFRNDHLQYALAWFSLAFALLGMLLWGVIKSSKKEYP